MGQGQGQGVVDSRGRRERESPVVVSAADPVMLVRPPRVGDGKLEHDKERRLGVASDLEAVIAVRGGGGWGRGEGAACQVPVVLVLCWT